ncbi:MAG: hypothetical protein ACRDTA_13545 [Pseudonocardiaceae bacterium]
MVQAYILIQTEVGKVAAVAAAVASLPGVQNVAGITRTLTCPVVHLS